MTRLLTLLFVASLSSCLSPDQITLTQEREMLELESLLKRQVVSVPTLSIEKKVTLDGVSDVQQLPYEAELIGKDLEAVLDLSFADLVQLSNYDKILSEQTINVSYIRKPGENYGPLSIALEMEITEEVLGAEIVLAEDNFLYQSHKNIKLSFDGSRLSQYTISGGQKLIGMDSSSYTIHAIIKAKS